MAVITGLPQCEDLGGLADGVLLQILTGVTKLRLAAAARRVTNGYEAFLAGFAPLSGDGNGSFHEFTH